MMQPESAKIHLLLRNKLMTTMIPKIINGLSLVPYDISYLFIFIARKFTCSRKLKEIHNSVEIIITKLKGH